MDPPFVLMRASFTPTFDFIAAYSGRKMVFDYNTFAIKGEICDELVLKNIMALINSNLFKYYFFMTGNVGVEKNRSSFSERKNFPVNEKILYSEELYELVCLMEDNYDLDDEINSVIYKCYNLSENEIALIDRMNIELIPQIFQKDKKTENNSNLDEYIKK